MEYELSDDGLGHRIYNAEDPAEEDEEEPEYTPVALPTTYDNDGELLIAFATNTAPTGLLAQKIYLIEPYDI